MRRQNSIYIRGGQTINTSRTHFNIVVDNRVMRKHKGGNKGEYSVCWDLLLRRL